MGRDLQSDMTLGSPPAVYCLASRIGKLSELRVGPAACDGRVLSEWPPTPKGDRACKVSVC